MGLFALIKEFGKACGYEILNRAAEPLDLWETDPMFLDVIALSRGKTLIDLRRLYVLYGIIRTLDHIPGQIAELGVYKGGSARLLARTLLKRGSPKQLFLFDTFQGLPEACPKRDLHKKGHFADTDERTVRAFLADCPNVRFYPGLFHDTLNAVQGERFALVHVDCDLYGSVAECCAFFYPRLNSGAFMVFDDYGFRSCPGAKQAVDEFFHDKPETPVYLPTGQCLLIKQGTGDTAPLDRDSEVSRHGG